MATIQQQQARRREAIEAAVSALEGANLDTERLRQFVDDPRAAAETKLLGIVADLAEAVASLEARVAP